MGIRGTIVGKAREMTISATVTRADGSIEKLGVIGYFHRNPLRRILGNLSS